MLYYSRMTALVQDLADNLTHSSLIIWVKNFFLFHICFPFPPQIILRSQKNIQYIKQLTEHFLSDFLVLGQVLFIFSCLVYKMEMFFSVITVAHVGQA